MNMTTEEKQLLLIDICSRLPYGVYVRINEIHCLDKNEAITEGFIGGYCKPNMCQDYSLDEIYEFIDEDDDVKPYLRPMSSMTEEERKEFSIFIGKTETYVQQIRLDVDSMANPIIGGFKCVYWGLFDRCIDWLNKNMFDYRGLIPIGLALEATKDMYKTE